MREEIKEAIDGMSAGDRENVAEVFGLESASAEYLFYAACADEDIAGYILGIG